MINLSRDQIALQKKAYEFAKEAFLPHEETWEENGTFPTETFTETVQAGYSGLIGAKELGGQAHSLLDMTLIYESLARGSFAFTFALGVHNVVSYGISQGSIANDSVREIVQNLTSGKKMVTIALTEPNAGSDPSSLETTASLQNDHYVINGTKKWVTNGKEADYIAVVAKVESDPKKTVMLLVNNHSEGIEIIDSPKKMGANFVSTPTIKFTNHIVAKDRLISEKGIRAALQTIDIARLSVAAYCIGLTQQAIESATKYLSERIQFGQPIIKNQGIQWQIAELQTELEATRWLTYHAASLIDAGEMSSMKLAMAKLKASDLAMRATVECAQLFGANGLLASNPMERYIKYAKIAEIVDGTSEIQKLVIGGTITKNALNNEDN